MKIAALADLHVTKGSLGTYRDFFAKVGEYADVVVLCGDLTDTGLPEEAQSLADDMSNCKVPVVAVLGNHDYESNAVDEVISIIESVAKCRILEGETIAIKGIIFAGIKGFGGGFDNHVLSAWGEKAIKDFVQEAVNDSLKLDSALAKLDSENVVVIMHYSPVIDTVRGEPEQIFPFLGCSRLAEPIDRRKAKVVFHGHAHKGALSGKTLSGIPVYNVTLSNLYSKNDGLKYFLYELI